MVRFNKPNKRPVWAKYYFEEETILDVLKSITPPNEPVKLKIKVKKMTLDCQDKSGVFIDALDFYYYYRREIFNGILRDKRIFQPLPLYLWYNLYGGEKLDNETI